MSIRSAVPADWEGISRLLTQLEYPDTAAFMPSKLARMLDDPAETLLVWAEAPASGEPLVPGERPSPPEPPASGESSATPGSPSPPEPPTAVEPAPATSGSQTPEKILGFLSLHIIPQIALPGDFARISYFAVDSDARSVGIGRRLEEHATRLARESGCVLMEVHCHTRRTRAHDFYARQGWIESPKYLIKKL